MPIKKKITKKESIDDLLTGDVKISVLVSARVSANFQTIGFEVGFEGTCKPQDKDRLYEKSWDIVNHQASLQMEDAEESLTSFCKLRNDLEK